MGMVAMTNRGDLDQPPNSDLLNPDTLALMTRAFDAAWKEAFTALQQTIDPSLRIHGARDHRSRSD